MPETFPIILDTDPGIDDAMALAFLSSDPRIRLLAITTVFGNADVATTTRNALFLQQKLGIDAQVFQGADHPLNGTRGRGAPHVHGADGMGDSGLTTGFSVQPSATAAHLQMIKLIRRHPHEITIVAIGPLTNLALALRVDPEIAGLVRDVIVMGGAFGGGGRHGNVTPYAEANIHNDPEAAASVFAAAWPIRVVGLDVTLDCVLTTDQARALVREAGESGQFLWDISRQYEALYKDNDGLDGCALHDVAAAICLVEPELFDYETGTFMVTTESAARGQTTFKPDTPSVHKVCRGVNADALVSFYMQSLIRAHLVALETR